MENKTKKFNCGELVVIDNITYTFLGYTDYRMTIGLFADKYGNKHERFL